MAKLAWSIPVLFVGAWVLTVGCDDDRGVVDIGAGGDYVGTAGSDAAGESGNHAGTGGAGGGDHAGGAGGAVDAACPSDISAAEGTSCAAYANGMICSDGADDPCQFGQSIVCVAGKWQRQEAFPAPCGGAGGAAGGGGAGAENGGVGGQ
jgi:hypothetical protein